MTNREREYDSLEHTVEVSATGRNIYKKPDGWECQPHNDNYWRLFATLPEAIRFATPPRRAA